MPYETDFDSAFSILLGKAIGAITLTGVPVTPAPVTGGTTATAQTGAIEFIIDGGGSVITNGNAGGLMVPWDCLITKVELQEFEGTTGSITVDIQHGTPGSSPTFSSITGSSQPRITSGRHYSDTALTGWTPTLILGDSLRFVVSGIATFTRITVCLFVRRTDVG